MKLTVKLNVDELLNILINYVLAIGLISSINGVNYYLDIRAWLPLIFYFLIGILINTVLTIILYIYDRR